MATWVRRTKHENMYSIRVMFNKYRTLKKGEKEKEKLRMMYVYEPNKRTHSWFTCFRRRVFFSPRFYTLILYINNIY